MAEEIEIPEFIWRLIENLKLDLVQATRNIQMSAQQWENASSIIDPAMDQNLEMKRLLINVNTQLGQIRQQLIILTLCLVPGGINAFNTKDARSQMPDMPENNGKVDASRDGKPQP